ncbi:uncharacterized protein PGTG_00493 [Puccinia graminis f. sp. tritici CRL 75-36-700-3]|uniref:Uncharacterized protein n=1 Tax=Puccinia graminis f. sp. tritici (strain CRL 75-36-700-3 / race SCCL) TaxID=418459 RepID=E3JRP4_PUCGT|nr:uncharacterized protein PGTG_00493 [Puccinia graminis f. sp. tritici CRL 75-36-700-3]EFP74537.1 hypothetical protein PGTG_00493 [Puccinia graminis f. sp. tritici CRL 75-36-700-3]
MYATEIKALKEGLMIDFRNVFGGGVIGLRLDMYNWGRLSELPPSNLFMTDEQVKARHSHSSTRKFSRAQPLPHP